MSECTKSTVIAVMLTAAAALAAPAAAQDLSLGYQLQRFSSDGDSLNAPVGVSLSLASAGRLGLVGQVDWSRKRESATVLGTSVDATATFTTFAGGIRWSGYGRSSALPFVEALFGAMRSSGDAHVAGEDIGSASGTDPIVQVGGGVSAPLAGGLGAFGQVDYRRIFAEGGSANGLRFVAGIRLGGR
jgi:hypothetical protein